MMHASTRSMRRGVCGAAATIGLLLAFASSAFAQADIQSSGPLTDITVGDDLSCEVTAYGSSQFFGGSVDEPGSCGWTLASGGTLYGYASDGNYWTSVSPATLSGDGTSQSPYRITTTVAASNAGTPTGLQLTEVDTYAVGDEYYQTDLTLQNSTGAPVSGTLYREVDCTLQGSDASYGFQDPGSGTVGCAQNANNSPSGPLEAFVPLTAGSQYSEGYYGTVDFTQPTAQVGYPNTCDCTTDEDSGMGLSWDIGSLPNGQSATFSLRSDFSATGAVALPIRAAGGVSLTGTAGSPLSGAVATVSDPNANDTAGNLSATIAWGDGSSSAGTISGGNGSFSMTGSHTYANAGSYTVTVTVTRLGDSTDSATATDSAVIAPPPVTPTAPVINLAPSLTAGASGFTGEVNPSGLATTASFQYGLDPKYSGGGALVYTNSTPPQSVGSDFSEHPVSASVSGLVPNAIYHARLVATNSAGTTFGPDLVFTTPKAPAPSTPTLGQTFNVAPVSGVVLVEVNGRFVPLTQLRQIPQNTVIDALHGAIQLVTVGAGTGGAHDASAKGKSGKKGKTKVKTQTGTFGGAVFKLSQAKHGANRGLVTLSLVEGAVKGAPSYGTCKARKAGEASAAALSSKTLQLLHATAKGKFSTRGRYSSATVRGTSWTIADRCDGTFTRDITHSVVVKDFVHHKTLILHAGQGYLARAPK